MQECRNSNLFFLCCSGVRTMRKKILQYWNFESPYYEDPQQRSTNLCKCLRILFYSSSETCPNISRQMQNSQGLHLSLVAYNEVFFFQKCYKNIMFLSCFILTIFLSLFLSILLFRFSLPHLLETKKLQFIPGILGKEEAVLQQV